MKAAVISALSSGQGKTLFTMSLLQWMKKHYRTVRPFKVGPDFIDTKFHEKIAGVDSINLDLYMMSEADIANMFKFYTFEMSSAIVEGVMGYYDGLDYETSTYNVAKALKLPVILVISGEGSYSTIIPTLKGIMDYRTDNTIKGVVLNKISSERHYQVIEKQIKAEIPNLKTLGWIEKGLNTISSRHLGLDITELDNNALDEIAESVMKNINITELLNLMDNQNYNNQNYPDRFFTQNIDNIRPIFNKINLTIVYDKAFSFLYPQNVHYFKNIFGNVTMISALDNQKIPESTNVVYIPGGYVETEEVAPALHKAETYKQSLRDFAANPEKRIYAECAGLMFLGEKIQTTYEDYIEGTGILSMDFEIGKRRSRLGYYKALDNDNLCIFKGHSFHYSNPTNIRKENAITRWGLFKDRDSRAQAGAWINKTGNVLGTYLHSVFFNQPELVLKYFNPEMNLSEIKE